MDRRKAMKLAAGALAGGGIGLVTLSTAFKLKNQPAEESHKLEYTATESTWKYTPLEPAVTAEIAYNLYSEGSCMFATVKSVISQLAETVGEPYLSFPFHMFKYGHGGVGGYLCVRGLERRVCPRLVCLVSETRSGKMIADIFQWYEKERFPVFSPVNPVYDYTLAKSVPNSILCHASNTNWCKDSGFKVDSKERKERCRRLTGDVAGKITGALNTIHANQYIANTQSNETVNNCLACHGKEGKVNNSSVMMDCNSCHPESIGHKVFADIHYKLMKE